MADVYLGICYEQFSKQASEAKTIVEKYLED